MSIFSQMLTEELQSFSTSVGFLLTFIVVILAAVSQLNDDRSRRRLIIVIIGLIIATTLIGQRLTNPNGFVQIAVFVVGIMIVTSLLFELVPFFDKVIGKLSHVARRITLISSVFTITILSILVLPFSYLYLYGLSYPPCGLSVSPAEQGFINSELPSFDGTNVAYLTWNGGRFNHEAKYCASVFNNIRGQVAQSLIPEVYDNNESVTYHYRVESPIEKGEVFLVTSIVNVSCKAHSCRDVDEGIYYVLQNSKDETWVSSEEVFKLLSK